MSENINRWKVAVCEARERYEACESPELEESALAYIGALESLCAAYENERD